MMNKTPLLSMVGLWTCLVLAADAARPVHIVRASSILREDVRRLTGIPLEGFGGTPDASVFPLQECQGDCDTDDDCDGDLVCFQRDEGGGAVPGCLGGENAVSRTDFCVQRVSASQVRNGAGGSSTLSFETTGASFISSHPDDFSGASPTTLIFGGIVSVAFSFFMF